MEAEDTALAGRRLADRYHLEAPIATGGMGTVWRARDVVLGRQVAVKVLRDDLVRNPDVLQRFRLEAVGAARLSHPNAMRVFDTGMDGEACFIVMELFSGTTLEQVIEERAPLPPEEAAVIVQGMLHGLAHAHREGVIHRDVKPANVLVDPAGLVKLTDFGIAKAAFATGDLTTTGGLLGTVAYLAPEQVSGGEVDGRTDLYATGLVLFELLTGRSAFEGDSRIEVAGMRLTSDPTPPGALRPGISRELERVVMRALARDPAERFPTAEEMSAALDRAVPELTAPPVPVVEGPPPPRPAFPLRRLLPWIAVVAVAAAVGVGAFLLVPRVADRGAAILPDGPELERVEVTATAYDPPPGDGTEGDDEAPLAVDGDRGTGWETEGYNTADFGGLQKEGVGLVLDLGSALEVAQVRVRTNLPGWRFELHAGRSPEGLEEQDVLEADGETSYTAAETLTLAVDPVEARYLLLWVTELTESTDRYRAEVAEIDVFTTGA